MKATLRLFAISAAFCVVFPPPSANAQDTLPPDIQSLIDEAQSQRDAAILEELEDEYANESASERRERKREEAREFRDPDSARERREEAKRFREQLEQAREARD